MSNAPVTINRDLDPPLAALLADAMNDAHAVSLDTFLGDLIPRLNPDAREALMTELHRHRLQARIREVRNAKGAAR